jgi:hypothetical protein
MAKLLAADPKTSNADRATGSILNDASFTAHSPIADATRTAKGSRTTSRSGSTRQLGVARTLQTGLGRGHSGHPKQRCDTDGESADNRERHLPAVGRHEVFCDPMCGGLASNRGWSRKQVRDNEADPERPGESECELAEDGNRACSKRADDETSHGASTVAMRP